jgi:flagellar biosynthesis protein FliR
MTLPDGIIEHTALYLIVLTRLCGLMITAPMVAGTAIPKRVKAGLVLMLGAAVHTSLASTLTLPPLDLLSLPFTLGAELMIGACMGVLAGLPLLGLEMAGTLLGHQMGLNIAEVYNPESDTQSDALSRVLSMLGVGAFMSLGGLEALFGALIDSFSNVPVGGFTSGQIPLDIIVGVIASGFEIALRVAAPALAVILLILIIIGALMKSTPQINVMTVGFAFKIVAGLAITAISLGAVNAVVGEHVSEVLGIIREWLAGL